MRCTFAAAGAAAVIAVAGSAFAGSAALAADMPVRGPAYKAPAPAYAPYSWTGFYVGGNLGGGWADHTTSATLGAATLFSSNTKPSGVIGGGQIGYNWQWNQVVFGLEADIQGSDQRGSATPAFAVAGVPVTTNISEKLDWFGTVRGRLGYAWDRHLVYFTGGWAYGHETATVTVAAAGVSATASGSADLNNGWTIGGGYEWAFADHWSVRAEYLYIDFGSDSAGTASAATPLGLLTVKTNDLTDNVVRGAVNYKF